MATVLTPSAQTFTLAEDLEDPTPYIALGTLVGVRLWTRKDRSAISHWPQVDLPQHWLTPLHSLEPGPRVSYAIDAQPKPHLVGRLTLRDMNPVSARIGIYLHPEQCGQGLGSAALLAFQRFVFGRGLLRRLLLDVAQDNTRAVRSYMRAGWKVEGAVKKDGFTYYEMAVES